MAKEAQVKKSFLNYILTAHRQKDKIMISTDLMVMFHKIGQLDYLWDVIASARYS